MLLKSAEVKLSHFKNWLLRRSNCKWHASVTVTRAKVCRAGCVAELLCSCWRVCSVLRLKNRVHLRKRDPLKRSAAGRLWCRLEVLRDGPGKWCCRLRLVSKQIRVNYSRRGQTYFPSNEKVSQQLTLVYNRRFPVKRGFAPIIISTVKSDKWPLICQDLPHHCPGFILILTLTIFALGALGLIQTSHISPAAFFSLSAPNPAVYYSAGWDFSESAKQSLSILWIFSADSAGDKASCRTRTRCFFFPGERKAVILFIQRLGKTGERGVCVFSFKHLWIVDLLVWL